MKRLFFILIFFALLFQQTYACDCIWGGPFLKLTGSPDLILQIKVMGHFNNNQGYSAGMEARILHIYKGEKTREMISIWGDNGMLCRPYISSYNFPVDSTFIISLYQSGGFGAEGESADDYYLSVCGEYYLSLSNNIVSGLIDGDTPKQMDLSVFEEKLTNVITDVETEDLPDEFKLEQNYPNPFNPTTNIAYSIPKQTNVNITIYDLLGNKLSVLLDEIKTRGNYTTEFDGSNLTSGVYYYYMKTEEFAKTKKMLLLK
ncbi:MAG: T9SS type A sorting domain-containing protein [Ignavibacteria bacterium]|jgi:hypothetical protein